MKDVEIIGMLKSYIKATLAGVGALKGAACTIQSIVDNGDGTHTVTFEWEDNDGVTHTDELVVSDGITPTIDSALSTSSENPVQNKVITTALNAKVGTDEMGVANGVATLDADGIIDGAQLPALLELGETSDKAYRGDRGKTAYDHSQLTSGTNPHNTTADNINLATALTIDGVSKSDTESAIAALAGLVDHVTDSEYNSIASVLS